MKLFWIFLVPRAVISAIGTSKHQLRLMRNERAFAQADSDGEVVVCQGAEPYCVGKEAMPLDLDRCPAGYSPVGDSLPERQEKEPLNLPEWENDNPIVVAKFTECQIAATHFGYKCRNMAPYLAAGQITPEGMKEAYLTGYRCGKGKDMNWDAPLSAPQMQILVPNGCTWVDYKEEIQFSFLGSGYFRHGTGYKTLCKLDAYQETGSPDAPGGSSAATPAPSPPSPLPSPAPVAEGSWKYLGALGCCSGERTEAGGKVFAGGGFSTLEDCQQKCTTFGQDCAFIDYFPPDWCFVWSHVQKCGSLDDSGNCAVATAYGFLAGESSAATPAPSPPSPLPSPAPVAEGSWEYLGALGCCSGERTEAGGKVFAGGGFSTKEDCQQKCTTFGQDCAFIDYFPPTSWCFIWSHVQKCGSLSHVGACANAEAWELQN